MKEKPEPVWKGLSKPDKVIPNKAWAFGYNDCHDQFNAYHEQEVKKLKGRIEELVEACKNALAYRKFMLDITAEAMEQAINKAEGK